MTNTAIGVDPGASGAAAAVRWTKGLRPELIAWAAWSSRRDNNKGMSVATVETCAMGVDGETGHAHEVRRHQAAAPREAYGQTRYHSTPAALWAVEHGVYFVGSALNDVTHSDPVSLAVEGLYQRKASIVATAETAGAALHALRLDSDAGHVPPIEVVWRPREDVWHQAITGQTSRRAATTEAHRIAAMLGQPQPDVPIAPWRLVGKVLTPLTKRRKHVVDAIGLALYALGGEPFGNVVARP